MSDKLEFRNQIQGAHEAPLPGPAREFGCSRTYHESDGLKFSNIYRMAK